MTTAKNSFLALLVLVLIAGGGGAWYLTKSSTGAEEAVPALPEGPRIVTSRVEDAGRPETQMVLREGGGASVAERLRTTVVHPLEVELTQLQRGVFATSREVLPPGSGANARLSGHILGDRGAGVSGTVTFRAGPNAGRVLRTDSQGNFGASDLYQGLSIVDLETDYGVRSVRQVMLRQLDTALLNVTLGREVSTSVRGIVKDRQGNPIHGAEVELDGGRAFTDDLGEFFFPRVSPDKVLAVVEKRGYAKYQQIVAIPRSTAIAKEDLQFVLYEGADLELRLDHVVGGPGPALAYVFPIGGQRVNSTLGQNTYPWHEVNPIELYAGGTALIEGLQPGHVTLTVFHSGGIASPPFEAKKLISGRTNTHSFQLRSTPTLRGVVKDEDGKPLAGATVTLEAPDRANATTKILQKKPTFSLSMVLPILPSGLQRVTTDRTGRFALTLYDDVSSSFYLTAVDRTGTLRTNRVVSADADEVELVLEPVAEDSATLRMRMGGRFQGLPVRVTVNGAPMEPFVLDPEDDLTIEGLEAGTWRTEIWWHHDQVERGRTFTLEASGETELGIVLPKGAIEGEPVPPDDAAR